jgi:hypothetical protein
MYVSTLEIAGNGPKWRFRTRKAATNFLLSIPNMAALLLILKKWLRVYLHVRLFGTVQHKIYM